MSQGNAQKRDQRVTRYRVRQEVIGQRVIAKSLPRKFLSV